MVAHEPSTQVYTQTVFLCIPLRLGVLFFATFTACTSLFYIIDWEYSQDLFRHFAGGYSLATRVLLGAVEITGLLFGLLGVMGAWYAKRRYVVLFNVWQAFRVVAWIFMYYADIPVVAKCEEWVHSVRGMTEAHGWNPIMYKVALAGECSHERTHFFVFSSVTFVLFLYVAWGTMRYADFMARLPRHLLQVPKDMTSNAFYAKSYGSEMPEQYPVPGPMV